MITPKFAYDAGLGIVDFTPTYHAVNRTPLAPLEAKRTDSVTSTGRKQSLLEHIAVMTVLAFEFVPESDLPAWAAFFEFALGGGQFTYYPDSSNPAVFVEYTLEDNAWAPKRVSLQNYSFTMKMRKFVGAGVHYS